MSKLQNEKGLQLDPPDVQSSNVANRQSKVDGVRRSRRYRMRKYIDCKSPAYGGIQGQMVNVSEEGVMLKSNTPVMLDEFPDGASAVVLTISFPSGKRFQDERVRLEAVPIWCNKSSNGEYYEVGLKWTHLSVPKKLMIKHWQRYCADAV